MRLRSKLFIFMIGLFLLCASSIWVYSGVLAEQINEEWAIRFIKKQILFDRNRTLLPIVREVAQVKEMAQEPTLLAMAEHDEVLHVREKGLETLEKYRLKFQDKSYFAAFVDSGNYYFNDHLNQYKGKERQYTLSQKNLNDEWFFYTIAKGETYQINVDTDSQMGTTKVWINFLLKKEDKVLGVVGTGFDFEQFLKDSVGVEQEGVRNFFINRNLSIQLARDTRLIDYASMSKVDGKRKTIDQFITNPNDVDAIQSAMQELYVFDEQIRTLWVNFEGKKRLLGLSYLKEIGWFNMTFIDSKELLLINKFSIIPILSVLFFISLLAVGLTLNGLVLTPINELKKRMKQLKEGDYEVEMPLVQGHDEIASLSRQFKEMVDYVRANNKALEEKVQERTLGLMQSEKKLNIILDSVEAYIYIKDARYRYLYANKKTCDLFGVSLDEVIGKEDSAFFNEATSRVLRSVDVQVIQYGKKMTREEVNTDVRGEVTTAYLSTKIPLQDEHGTIYALCGISTDITERKKTEELIKSLAFHDALSGLPNRRMLDERLRFFMTQSKRTGQCGALMVIDLDNFKPLNDTFGHKAGDELLVDVAKRLLACVRESDTVARFGGDEFVVVLSVLSSDENRAKEHAMVSASAILHELSKPYHIDVEVDGTYTTIEHHCTASIGLQLFCPRRLSADKLFLDADKAMYTAKQKGRNRVEFFEENE